MIAGAVLAGASARAQAPGLVLMPEAVRGAGARAVALGGAFVAVGGTSDSLFFNPAGLGLLRGFEVFAHHHEGMAGMREERVAGAFDLGVFGTLAAGLHEAGYGDLPARDERGYPFDGATVARQGATAGWGMSPFRDFAAGLSWQAARLQLMGRTVNRSFLGAGLMQRVQDRVFLGVAVRGLGPRDQEGDSPLVFSVGGAYRLSSNRPAQVALAAELPVAGSRQVALGIEQEVAAGFSARVGLRYFLSDDRLEGFRSITAGFGWRRGPLVIDYAADPQGELGLAHRVSLGASVLEKPGPSPTPTPVIARPVPPLPTPTPAVSNAAATPTGTKILAPDGGVAGPVVPSKSGVPEAPPAFPSPASSPATPEPPAPSSAPADQLRVYSQGPEKGLDATASSRVKELLDAVKRPGAGAEAWWELGQFYELSGYPDYARQCYANVLKLDPRHPGARGKWKPSPTPPTP